MFEIRVIGAGFLRTDSGDRGDDNKNGRQRDPTNHEGELRPPLIIMFPHVIDLALHKERFLCIRSSLQAPKARNGIAWASGPGFGRAQPLALKVRNNLCN
jgi:hypothetical protein